MFLTSNVEKISLPSTDEEDRGAIQFSERVQVISSLQMVYNALIRPQFDNYVSPYKTFVAYN